MTKIYIKNLNKVWGGCFTIKRYQDLSFNIKDGLVNIAYEDVNIKSVMSDCTNYFYISLRNTALPYELKHLVFKGGMTQEIPTEIKTIRLDDFYYLAYGVKMLKPDAINVIIIINKNDIFNFIGLYKKANKRRKYNVSSWISMFKEDDGLYDDITDSYIRSSIEYNKIFNLDEFTRKEFFTMCKECGLNKANRNLLKDIRKKAGGRSFSCYLEDLEEAIDKAEGLQKDLLQKKYNKLSEEDNSWNNIKTNINDYWYY